MKLNRLLHCVIYRDGGSYEGIWLTDQNKEWALTLRIEPWDKPDEIKYYKLFNCKIDDTKDHSIIEKGSNEHMQMMTLINNWLEEVKNELAVLDPSQRLSQLILELEKGNY